MGTKTSGRKRQQRPKRATPRRSTRSSSPVESQITKAEAAERLGLTERRLEQLVVEDPSIPCVGRGAKRRFQWPALIEWERKRQFQLGVRSIRPQSVEEARARKLAAEADLAEIELAERRKQLVPAALFRQEYEGACARLRAALLNAAHRYAPQFVEQFAKWVPAGALRKVEDLMSRMVHEIMSEIEAGEDVPEDEDPPGLARTGTGPVSA